MRLRVLGCSGGSAPGHHLSCYLIDDVLAVDAGALTTALDLPAQRKVQDVLLTHALPLFLANRFGGPVVPCRLWGSSYTLETVRQHLFNDRIWPDFTEAVRESVPLVQFVPADPMATVTVLDYEVTAWPLVHAVPCQAYCVKDRSGKAIVVCGDTYRTDGLYRHVNEAKGVRALVIECSFPNRYDGLAKASLHMTARLLGQELSLVRKDVQVFVTHVKPEDKDEVVSAVSALKDPRVRVLSQGETLTI
jgi:3',5'-cyclic-nucleotide phosphodiesterase